MVPGAKVDVGALVASTLDITDKNFMDGQLKFAGDGYQGTVSNEGTINAAEFIAMLGSQVYNHQSGGIFTGSAALVAADEVTLTLGLPSGLQVQIDKGALQAYVANAGMIGVTGTDAQPFGSVELSAMAADDTAIRALVDNEGVIEANSVTGDGGRIVLTALGLGLAGGESVKPA